MSTLPLTQGELQESQESELRLQLGENLDLRAGSILNALSGSNALTLNEVMELIIFEVSKLYFSTARGPTAQDSTDYLEKLALDRFGVGFSRPQATRATVDVTFSVASGESVASNFVIPSGTIVTTSPDSNGEVRRYQTLEDARGVSAKAVTVQAEAIEAGSGERVLASQITLIESAGFGSIEVVNSEDSAGGEDQPDDEAYRIFIQNKQNAIQKGT